MKDASTWWKEVMCGFPICNPPATSELSYGIFREEQRLCKEVMDAYAILLLIEDSNLEDSILSKIFLKFCVSLLRCFAFHNKLDMNK